MDKIIINNLKVFAYHGVNPEEKENGQNFYLDIELELPLDTPCRTDDLSDTINYSKVIKTVIRAMNDEKYDLIERAAHHVCKEIMREFNAVKTVSVTLKKPEAPISCAEFGYVAVNITRSRKA